VRPRLPRRDRLWIPLAKRGGLGAKRWCSPTGTQLCAGIAIGFAGDDRSVGRGVVLAKHTVDGTHSMPFRDKHICAGCADWRPHPRSAAARSALGRRWTCVGINDATIRVIPGRARVSSDVSVEFWPENHGSEAPMSPMRPPQRAKKGQRSREAMSVSAKVRRFFREMAPQPGFEPGTLRLTA
jgi:hypothetical protein